MHFMPNVVSLFLQIDYTKLEKVPGYDLDSDAVIPVPPVQMTCTPEILQFNIYSDAKGKTQAQAKEMLLKYVNDQCCWGAGPAKACEFDSCVGLSSFHTKVETYVETRTTKRDWRAYVPGTPYSSPSMGTAPLPWQIQCVVHPFFTDQEEYFEVPFTSTIQRCHTCCGSGKVTCPNCNGSGRVRCGSCSGSGRVTRHHTTHTGMGKHRRTHHHTTTHTCSSCSGSGKVTDSRCGGSGKITCGSCHGSGQLRHFIGMLRRHFTLVNEKVVDMIPGEDLSPKEVSSAKGTTIINSTTVNIQPPNGFNTEVDAAMQYVDDQAALQIRQHCALQHQERLTLRCVPVTAAKVHTNEAKFRFYIYGDDNQIKILDYPATTCCGCDIA